MLVLRRANNFNLKPPEKTPEVEWWDEFFLPPGEPEQGEDGETEKIVRFGPEVEE